MIASSAWAFVALVGIAAGYDLVIRAIRAWAPKPPISTGHMIDNTLFAAQLASLKNDMNALKIAVGFKIVAGKTEGK